MVGTTAASANGHGSSDLTPEGMAECAKCAIAMGDAGKAELAESAIKSNGDEIAVGMTAALVSGIGSSALAPEGMTDCATAMGNAGEVELGESAIKSNGDEVAVGTTAALVSGIGSSALAPGGMTECATAMGYAVEV